MADQDRDQLTEEEALALLGSGSAIDKCLESEYFNFLSPHLSNCRKKKRFCDIKLKLGEKIFECHRVILASNSKFFMALFKGEFENAAAGEEIRCLSNEYVDEKSFSKLLDAMYGGSFEIDGDWIPLFTTSMFLQLTHFIDQCERYVLKNLEKMDLTELIVLPELKIVKNLYSVVKKHICHHFPNYYSRLGGISLDILEDLLSDPELFVSDMRQLFDLGKKWIVHDIKNRKQHLQFVASLLKPFHTSCEQSLKIVSDMGNLMQNEYAVKICLKTLLESSGSQEDKKGEGLKLDISGTLFFVQPNDESEVLFGAFEDESWVFLNEYQVPVSTALLNTYDSAVVNETLYFVADRDNLEDELAPPIINFHKWSEEMREWVELMPPRNMPECLVPCHSTLYLYENSVDSYQFSSFEPMLNRWLKVPPVNYPRLSAGVATSNEILYMVGGIPQKEICSETPTNIVEMYDSRSGHWSRVSVSSSQGYEIRNDSHHRKVCFAENTLFILDAETLVLIDSRNRKVLETCELGEDLSVRNCHLTMNKPRELWIVDVKSHTIDAWEIGAVMEKTSFTHPNVFIRPISVQL